MRLIVSCQPSHFSEHLLIVNQGFNQVKRMPIKILIGESLFN